MPATMTVVGAGVIGIEYASVFAAMGTRVTVIERQVRLLPFVDAEIIEALQYHLRELRVSCASARRCGRQPERGRTP